MNISNNSTGMYWVPKEVVRHGFREGSDKVEILHRELEKACGGNISAKTGVRMERNWRKGN